jgi:hypothetical protein
MRSSPIHLRTAAAGALVLLAACTMLGCGSHPDSNGSGSSGVSGSDGGPKLSCIGDSRAQTYVAGLEQAGSAKNVSIRILDASPAPPGVGNNEWTIQLLDAKGNPIDDSTIDVKPFMPDHGHGSSIVPTVTPTGADGKYDVTLLQIFMPGLWQVTFTVKTPSTGDTVMFSFCVEG